MARPHTKSETCHASCVTVAGHAALITGASGSGKSGLALQLMGYGAGLVADDRTILTQRDGLLIAAAPDTLRGQVEARFVGILAAPYAGPSPVRLVVSLDEVETERLPLTHHTTLLGVQLPLIRRAEAPHFAAAIYAWLKGSRIA